jgi:hypothetical protein
MTRSASSTRSCLLHELPTCCKSIPRNRHLVCEPCRHLGLVSVPFWNQEPECVCMLIAEQLAEAGSEICRCENKHGVACVEMEPMCSAVAHRCESQM